MQALIEIDTRLDQPIYQQIVEAVINSIEVGKLDRGSQLPSIGELARSQNIAKVTVVKAYEALRQRGILQARQGKGFYVASTQVRSRLNIFLLFDTLNAYKETLYEALKAALPTDAQLSLFFHHYDREQFEQLIRNNLNKYNYYVVMPHFNEDVSEIIGLIPGNQLLIIDKAVERLAGEYAAITQDFERDIYQALRTGLDRLRQYRKLSLVLSRGHFQFIPDGILAGFRRFSDEGHLPCAVVDQFSPAVIRPGEAYLLFAERDLIQFIKYVHRTGLRLGRQVGLIAYDDTPMKEILEGGITVISTDFEQMGHTAGRLIAERSTRQLTNPVQLIRRKSL